METKTHWNNNHWVLGIALAFMLIVAAVLFPNLPDRIPTHFNINGEPDAWLPKTLAIWVMPILAAGVWGVMTVAPKIDPKKDRYEKFAASYNRIKIGVMVFLTGLHLLLMSAYDEPQLLTRMILLGAALLFAFLGNEMGRFEQTWFAGIRNPWTLADERVWRRTHRVGARWFTGMGILNAITVLVLPLPIATLLLVATALGVAFGIMAYSYVLYRRYNG